MITNVSTSNVNELVKRTAELVANGFRVKGEVKNSLDWQEGEAIVMLSQDFEKVEEQTTFWCA